MKRIKKSRKREETDTDISKSKKHKAEFTQLDFSRY